MVTIPFDPEELSGLDPDTVRLFLLDPGTGAWVPVKSRLLSEDGVIEARIERSGMVTAIGLSRFDVVRRAQTELCSGRPERFPDSIDRICTVINCPALDLSPAGLGELATGEFRGVANVLRALHKPASTVYAS